MNEHFTKRYVIGGNQILLGDDPWSEAFLARWAGSFWGQTVKLWLEKGKVPARETPYFEAVSNKPDYLLNVWPHLRDPNLLVEKIDGYYKIFRSIKDEGYHLFENALLSEGSWNGKPIFSGPLSCQINEKGHLEIEDGHHRIGVISVLGLKVPLHVVDRYPGWEEFRIRVYETEKGKRLYQTIPHPDFADWPVGRKDEQRYQLIPEAIQKTAKPGERIVEAGCNYGYVLYRIHKAFPNLFKLTGVEFLASQFKVAQFVLSSIGVECVQQDVVDFFSELKEPIGGVILLSVFHHIARMNPEEKTLSFLKCLGDKVRFILYDIPHKGDPAWGHPVPEKYKEDPLGYLVKGTGFSNKVHMGETDWGRSLWLLTK